MLYGNYIITLLICNKTTENKYNKDKEAKIAFLSSLLIHSIWALILREPCILILPYALQTVEQVEVSSYKMQMELREMLLFLL